MHRKHKFHSPYLQANTVEVNKRGVSAFTAVFTLKIKKSKMFRNVTEIVYIKSNKISCKSVTSNNINLGTVHTDVELRCLFLL